MNTNCSIAVLGALALASLAALTAQTGPLLLDQAHEVPIPANVMTFSDFRPHGQTFTVGTTGVLARVDLGLWALADQGFDLEIRATDPNGDIDGSAPGLLGTVSVPAGAAPTFLGPMLAIDCSAVNLTVTAGAVLAVVVKPQNGSLISWLHGVSAQGDYPGGQSERLIGTTWISFFSDFSFRTWLTVPGRTPATVATGGATCFPRVTYEFAPIDGTGGYDVSTGPAVFDTDLGTLAGATSDNALVRGLDLGFAMHFPDGTLSQIVDLDPNGRILPGGLGSSEAHPAPSLVTSVGYPFFFGAWTDWDPSSPFSDGIYWKTDGNVATFTWNAVVQTLGWKPCTWQIALHSDGRVRITHQDLRNFNDRDGGFANNNRIAVGVTNGNGADPGELDLSALVATTAGPIAYEYWDSLGPHPVEPFDLKVDAPLLTATGRPVQGATWTLQVTRAGGAAFGIYIVGVTQQDVSLEPLGVPCSLLVDPYLTAFALADGTGGLAPFAVSVPAQPVFLGVPVVVQAVTDGAPFATPYWLTNAVVGGIGDV